MNKTWVNHAIVWAVAWLGALAAAKTQISHNALSWVYHIGGATGSNQSTGNDLNWLILAGLAGSFYWRPAISIATAATTVGIIGRQFPAPGFPLLLWFAWVGSQWILRKPLAIEHSPFGIIAGLLAIWIATTGDAPELPYILLGVALVSTGNSGRLGTTLACWLMAMSIQPDSLNKNPMGQIQVAASMTCLTTPGWFAKLLALAPTTFTFQSDAASAKLATAALWGVWGMATMATFTPESVRTWCSRRKTVLGIAAAIACIAISPWAFPWAAERVGRSTSLTGRTTLWEFCIEWIKANPWEGYGTRFWGEHCCYFWYHWSFPGYHAHNEFFQSALVYGLPATFLMIGIVLTCTLHRHNLGHTKIITAIPWLTAITELASWSWVTAISPQCHIGMSGDAQPAPRRLPPKKFTLIAGSACFLWAASVWFCIPQTKSRHEEIWLPANVETEKFTADSKTAPASILQKKINRTGFWKGCFADRRYYDNMLVVSAPSKDILDQTAAELLPQQTFLRVLPATHTVSQTRFKFALSLTPLILLALIALPPRAISATTILLLTTAWIVATPYTKPEYHFFTTIETGGIGGGETLASLPCKPRWAFLMEEKARGQLLARALSTGTRSVRMETAMNFADPRTKITLRSTARFTSQGEVDIKRCEIEQILEDWKTLPKYQVK